MMALSASRTGSYPSAADRSGSVTAIWPVSDGTRRTPKAVLCVVVDGIESDAAPDFMVNWPVVNTSMACDQAAKGTWGYFCCVASVLASVHSGALHSLIPPSTVLVSISHVHQRCLLLNQVRLVTGSSTSVLSSSLGTSEEEALTFLSGVCTPLGVASIRPRQSGQ